MPGEIFISYRCDDFAGDARGLRDGLAARFGQRNVFMDIDNLLPGQRFDRKLAEALSACDILIAVIGPRWMELLGAKTARGEPDYVRAEIGEALRRGIVVIPVRVGLDGRMPELPRPEDLPADIRDLVLHQKHDVVHEHFGRDLAALAQAIVEIPREKRPEAGTQIPWRWVAAGVGLVAVVFAALYLARDGKQGAAKAEKQPKVAIAPGPTKPEAQLAPTSPPASKVAPKEVDDWIMPVFDAADERGLKPLARFRDCKANDWCGPNMVVVPAGSFTMGSPPTQEGRSDSEGPQRRVTIARPFAVGKFEVTFEEWDACVAEGGCSHRPDDSGMGRGKRPVMRVSWDEITKEYLSWLSRKTGRACRLLTEAEWEYVARAGTTTPFWWGSSISTSKANYDGNYTYGGGPKGEYRRKTVPADSFAANPWGLYNVHGNVWEWVQDCWNDNYSGAPSDGSARTTGDCGLRVLRGGSWDDGPLGLRAADRFRNSPDLRSNIFGFRVGRTLTP
jgi:formylglycine-generating enzyme required for sulfatase activity